jgi:hypothetical protein
MAYEIPEETVDSSNLASYGYDAETKVLAVRFKSGDLWHYSGVGLDVALAFGNAESKGKFFSANVKGKFSGEKMTGACPNCGAKGRIGVTCDDCGTTLFERTPRHDDHAGS